MEPEPCLSLLVPVPALKPEPYVKTRAAVPNSLWISRLSGQPKLVPGLPPTLSIRRSRSRSVPESFLVFDEARDILRLLNNLTESGKLVFLVLQGRFIRAVPEK